MLGSRGLILNSNFLWAAAAPWKYSHSSVCAKPAGWNTVCSISCGWNLQRGRFHPSGGARVGHAWRAQGGCPLSARGCQAPCSHQGKAPLVDMLSSACGDAKTGRGSLVGDGSLLIVEHSQPPARLQMAHQQAQQVCAARTAGSAVAWHTAAAAQLGLGGRRPPLHGIPQAAAHSAIFHPIPRSPGMCST